MSAAFRTALRYLGLDARQPDRPEVHGSWLDLVLFLVGIAVIVAILVERPA